MTGYDMRNETPPRVTVGSTRFDMFASRNEGFIADDNEEQRLLSAMRRGSSMRVEAVSQRGTNTSYRFSLLGVTAAIGKIQETCG